MQCHKSQIALHSPASKPSRELVRDLLASWTTWWNLAYDALSCSLACRRPVTDQLRTGMRPGTRFADIVLRFILRRHKIILWQKLRYHKMILWHISRQFTKFVIGDLRYSQDMTRCHSHYDVCLAVHMIWAPVPIFTRSLQCLPAPVSPFNQVL